MKKIALVLLLCFWGLNVGAKDEVLKISKYVVYTGELIKKEPFGNGVLTVTNKVSSIPVLQLSGVFNGAEVSEATLSLPGGYSYKGDLVFQVSKKPSALIFVFGKGGQVYDPDTKLIGVVGDEDCVIVVAPDDITRLAGEGTLEERAIPSSISEYIQFAEDTSYTIEYSVIPIDQPASSDKSMAEDYTNTFPFEVDNDKWTYSPLGYAPVYTVTFSNGTVIRADENDCEKWEKPSGDYIKLEAGGSGVHPIDFYIHVGDEEYVKSDQIRHIFENGNVYEGTYNSEFLGYYSDYRKLIGLKEINWKWSDFYQGAGGGELKYSDGSRYDGSFSSKTKQIIDNKLSDDSYYTGTQYDRDGRIVHEYRDGKNEIQFAEEAKRAEEEKQRLRMAYEESIKTDFVEFNPDNTNYIKAFKKTLLDGSVIEAEDEELTVYGDLKQSKYDDFKISYPNGTIFQSRLKIPSSSSWYENNILNLKSAPQFSDFILFPNDLIIVLEGTWRFQDGVVIDGGSNRFSYNYPDDMSKVRDLDYWGIDSGNDFNIRDQKENGDYAKIRFYKNRLPISMNDYMMAPDTEKGDRMKYELLDRIDEVLYFYNGYWYDGIKAFRKTFPDYIAIGEKEFNLFSGELRYNDGSRFEGTFDPVIIEGPNSISSDPRIETLGASEKLRSSVENISEIKKYKGEEFDSDGNIVAAYENGEKVSDFRLSQIIRAEKARIEKAEEEVREKQRREKEYNDECTKYGKKYVDAWLFEGTFIVGTPEEYLLKCVDVKPYYESNITRSYHLKNILGDVLVNIDVDKATRKIKYVYDRRR